MTTTPFATGDSIVWKRQLAMQEAYLDTISDSNLIGKLINLGTLNERKELSKAAGDSITFPLVGRIQDFGFTNNDENTTNRKRHNIYSDELKLYELSQVMEAEANGTLSAQMTEFGDLSDTSVLMNKEWLQERMAVGVVNQLTGNTATSITWDSLTHSTASQLLQVNAGQTPTAPTSTRVYRPNSNATDQAVNADTTATFKLSQLARLLRVARTTRPYMPALKGDVKFVCLLHPDVWLDAQLDVTDPFQFRDVQLSGITSGKQQVIEYGDDFQFMDCRIILTDKCPRGVHSSSAAEQTNTRRGVLLGAKAGTIAWGKGFSLGGETTPGFGTWEQTEQVGRVKAYRSGVVWGMTKSVFNGIDYSSITFTNYVAQ